MVLTKPGRRGGTTEGTNATEKTHGWRDDVVQINEKRTLHTRVACVD